MPSGVRCGLAACVVVGLASCSTPPPPTPAQQLSWLTGTWAGDRAEHTVQEHWVARPDGGLLGLGHTFAGTSTVTVEGLSIDPGPAGPVLTVVFGASEPVSYGVETMGERSITFWHPTYTTPQRITYARPGADQLTVTAEGAGGKSVSYRLSKPVR